MLNIDIIYTSKYKYTNTYIIRIQIRYILLFKYGIRSEKICTTPTPLSRAPRHPGERRGMHAACDGGAHSDVMCMFSFARRRAPASQRSWQNDELSNRTAPGPGLSEHMRAARCTVDRKGRNGTERNGTEWNGMDGRWPQTDIYNISTGQFSSTWRKQQSN
jgi:hypothetical protein